MITMSWTIPSLFVCFSSVSLCALLSDDLMPQKAGRRGGKAENLEFFVNNLPSEYSASALMKTIKTNKQDDDNYDVSWYVSLYVVSTASCAAVFFFDALKLN